LLHPSSDIYDRVSKAGRESKDDQKLDLLWRVGRVLKDLVVGQSVITFCGRDRHEGKTKLKEILTMILTDAVEWTTEDSSRFKSKWPKVDKVMYLCIRRILRGRAFLPPTSSI
jgi:hypothetical protein